MRKLKSFIALFFISFSLCAQKSTWVAFYNNDSTLIGFKDSLGTVRIEPKFTDFTYAHRFDNIIAVTEQIDGKYKSYYITKSGRKIGFDSLHFYDNSPDCESEGFIRFKDYKTDKVGMFDKNGNVAIPAEYNSLSRVQNGMVVALKDAKRECFDRTILDKNYKDCEHWGWKGGQYFLIDTNNNVLIENFSKSSEINFYSLQKSKSPSEDPIRSSIKGVDSSYYTFIEYDKEFNHWFSNVINDSISKNQLLEITHSNVVFWIEDWGWKEVSSNTFLDSNFLLVKEKLLEIKNNRISFHVFNESLNSYMLTNEKYALYFNNCGEALSEQYPEKDIVINRYVNKDMYQDHLAFLRTPKGYKLFSATFKTGILK